MPATGHSDSPQRSEWVEDPAAGATLDCSTDEPAEGGERQLALFRVGALLRGDQRDLCLVKKVSKGGALIRAYSNLGVGDRVSLDFEGQAPIEGEVESVDGASAQIGFNQAIDVIGLLKVGSGGTPPRMPRVEVQAFALIRHGAVVHRVTIENISQGGVCAACNAAIDVGEPVTVTLSGMPPVPGVIRWSRSGRCGITFNTVMGLPLLVEWLNGRTTGEAASA